MIRSVFFCVLAVGLVLGWVGAQEAGDPVEELHGALRELQADPGAGEALLGRLKVELDGANAQLLTHPSMTVEEAQALHERIHALTVGRELVRAALATAGDVGLDPGARAEGRALFESHVGPLFRERCLECHNPNKARSGFDVSNRVTLLAGGDIGVSIVPGEPEASLLLRMLRHETEPFMPHKEEALSAEAIARVAEWIRLGAPYAGPLAEEVVGGGEMVVTDRDRSFWSFRPLARVTPPAVNDEEWVETAVDRFILAGLEEAGLRPAPRADRRTLIRRVYYDLIGLPPTPEEVSAFVSAERPDAYERLVEGLLASPHYGERWGRHWLDLARYADSAGYEFDVERPTAYHYRDFVISALNEDMPYDEFLKWQLAGDEYAPENPLAHAATGFLTSGPAISNQETELNRYNELDDMAGTTASVFLGLTMSCARCHDHKYDPIPTRDYYRMLAAFTPSKRTDAFLADGETIALYEEELAEWRAALRPVESARREFLNPHRRPVYERKVAALEVTDEIRRILLSDDEADREAREEYRRIYRRELSIGDGEIVATLDEAGRAEWSELSRAVDRVRRDEPRRPPTTLALADHGKEAEASYLLTRGNPELKAETVDLGFLSVLPGTDSGRFDPARFRGDGRESTYRRTALAEWLTDVEEGAGRLTARVMANRLWHYHFGRGLVGTPSDFGMQGDRPTHPELLDWLAGAFIEQGWRLKEMHRVIMLSAAYQQSTAHDATQAEVDPQNRLWWRREPMRVEAEVLRDAMLAVSNCLNEKMFGPGVFPYMHPDAIATGSTNKWPKDVKDGPETWRRSVYIYTRRSARMPMMEAFDAPDTTQSCARRMTTTIPSQALALMNSPFVHEQAHYFAARVRSEADGPAGWVERAYRLALGRGPEGEELGASVAFLERQAALRGSMADALEDFCQVVLSLNEFVYVN